MAQIELPGRLRAEARERMAAPPRRLEVARNAGIVNALLMIDLKRCGKPLNAAWVAGLLILAGCSSADKPASASFASVVLRGNTPGQISEIACQVFEENGYKIARSGMSHLIFEKEASAMSNFLYGNWLDSDVWTRVRASIEPVGEATFRLQCQAYMLRDRGGTTEEEIKISGMRSKPYQKLLDEVAKRLSGPAEP